MIKKTYIGGLKWAGLKQMLYNGAIVCNVDLTITDHDKGWFRETIYFEIEGTQESINKMMNGLRKAVNNYNGEDNE